MNRRHSLCVASLCILFVSSSISAQQVQETLQPADKAINAESLVPGEVVEIPPELTESPVDSNPIRVRKNPSARLTLAAKEDFPELLAPARVHQAEARMGKAVFWKSDDFIHRNLIFEQPALERCGEVKHPPLRQFFRSTAHFFGNGLALPITALRGKQNERVIATGGH